MAYIAIGGMEMDKWIVMGFLPSLKPLDLTSCLLCSDWLKAAYLQYTALSQMLH